MFRACCSSFLLLLHQVFFPFGSVCTAGWGRETRVKAALTSEIKNPFALLNPFGGWPKEKQLLDWQCMEERARELNSRSERVLKGAGSWTLPSEQQRWNGTLLKNEHMPKRSCSALRMSFTLNHQLNPTCNLWDWLISKYFMSITD